MSTPDRLLARLVRKGGGQLLNKAIDRILPDTPAPTRARKNIFSGIAGLVAMRVATRSVPGAIVVTSGLVAKKLYDRRKAKQAGQNPKPKA